jgi:putative ABC transport system permease protein
MEERMWRTMAMPRFYSTLFGAFALFAFFLSASGIYASMRYLVGQRRHEFGIRLALGGSPRALLRTVIARGAALTALGIVIGLCGALATSRLLEGYLFGITTTDPTTFLAVAGLLSVVAMVACYVPARRAAGAHPTEILGAE